MWRKFCTAPILAKIKYINGDVIDSTTPAVFILGSAFHKAMDVYYGGSDTLVPTNESEAIQYGLQAGMEYIEMMPEGFIKWSAKLDTKQKLFDKMSYAFNTYVQERPYTPGIVFSTEEHLKELIEVEWHGTKVSLPVMLEGYTDRIDQDENGDLTVVDYKTVDKFSNPDKIDGNKMIASVFYFFLCFAKHGRAPKRMRFEEVKHSKNRDGSDQIKDYVIEYAENVMFFDLFFRMYQDITDHLNGKAVYLPNLDAMFDGDIELIAYINRLDVEEEKARKMEEQQVDNITDLLKKEIANASSMKQLLATVERDFVSAKSLNYETMKTHERIQTKMMEHGMMIRFDSEISGHAVDQYRFTPSVGLKMSRIEAYVKDVEQVLGVAGIRVLAPIPGTSFVGFEVPKSQEERTFPELPAESLFPVLQMGVDVMGEPYNYDLRKMPHALIAGATNQGKSVLIDNLIRQMLGKAELHLFDPKLVELAEFEDDAEEYETEIPKIFKSLKRLAKEMDERYKTLREMKKKNVEGTDIPYKVIIIDEYGDIVVQKTPESKMIVDLVQRLAQKGRAAGMHVIISTQRPSVDVISGVIKANFPTRIAFRTASDIDSMVIMGGDHKGASKLRGMGDMLFLSDQDPDPVRLQGYKP